MCHNQLNFPNWMLTIPEISIIAFDEYLVADIKKLIAKMNKLGRKITFNNDTEFNLTGFYVTLLSYQHPMLEKDKHPGVSPCIPLGYFFHEKKNQNSHMYFWKFISEVY
jgi:hypothetical protein